MRHALWRDMHCCTVDYDHSKVSWRHRNMVPNNYVLGPRKARNMPIIILAFYFIDPFSNIPGKGSLQL